LTQIGPTPGVSQPRPIIKNQHEISILYSQHTFALQT
jgi:hypothetical protein